MQLLRRCSSRMYRTPQRSPRRTPCTSLGQRRLHSICCRLCILLHRRTCLFEDHLFSSDTVYPFCRRCTVLLHHCMSYSSESPCRSRLVRSWHSAWDAWAPRAGRGPPQPDLVNCILSQFEFGASDGAGPWGRRDPGGESRRCLSEFLSLFLSLPQDRRIKTCDGRSSRWRGY